MTRASVGNLMPSQGRCGVGEKGIVGGGRWGEGEAGWWRLKDERIEGEDIGQGVASSTGMVWGKQSARDIDVSTSALRSMRRNRRPSR